MTDLLKEILDYLPGPRNGPYEHELACKRLREVLLYERIKILKATLPVDITFTLKIAKNAMDGDVVDREFTRPGLLTGDVGLMKYYLRYGGRADRGFSYLEKLVAGQPHDYARISALVYYYPAYLGRNAKPRRAWFKALVAELGGGGHLAFDPNTWEGGPNDIEWFADIDQEHRVWFPPIRDLLDKRIAGREDVAVDE